MFSATLSRGSHLGGRPLISVLSLTTESVDVIGFLGLGGLLCTYVIGNIRHP